MPMISTLRVIETGKFEDPTNYLDPEQVQKVVFFWLSNLNGNLADFREENQFSKRGIT